LIITPSPMRNAECGMRNEPIGDFGLKTAG